MKKLLTKKLTIKTNFDAENTADIQKFNDACDTLKAQGFNFETGTETVATQFLRTLYFRYSLTTDVIIWVLIPLLTLIWVF
jgi:hypothetical protein|tara:strand:- start:149 stop:391 length:243 start_codon:yes stop_codon:yes gene_type:complete